MNILDDNSKEFDSSNFPILQDLLHKRIWSFGKPLRLHLGCGKNHFEGYINIDYPPSEHTVQTTSGADFFADITTLSFPPLTVDEIRLHHVFEHFDRATALAMLIKWHQWLKIGGKLHIETPDFIGNVKTFLLNAAWSVKMGIIRHIVGSHEASWAYHIDQWFADRFEHTLSKLGFDHIQIDHISWQKEPYLSNVHAIARKSREVTLNELLQSADELLWESTVSISEKPLHEVWGKKLRAIIESDMIDMSNRKARLHEINIFRDDPSFDNIGYDDWHSETNGEFACIEKLIRPSDIVFDVGANKGMWSSFVLQNIPSIKLWAFEPIRETFSALSNNLAGLNASLHNIAISDCNGEKLFYFYDRSPESAELSTFYRRPEVEHKMNISATPVKVVTQSLDVFCGQNGIHNINFLKIDVEGAEYDVLTGAKSLLQKHSIKMLQFEYGGTYKDAKITLRQIYDLLVQRGYLLFRIAPDGIIYIPIWRDSLENYRYSNYIALQPSEKDLLILGKICSEKSLKKALGNLAELSPHNEALSGLIFSKDRALQLDATLRSLFLHCKDPDIMRLKVLYVTSSSIHQKQYHFLTTQYPSVDFVGENNFKNDLLSLLYSYKYVLFLVDDNIFVKDFSLGDVMRSLEQDPKCLGFSLRLGQNTSYCYPLNRQQPLPDFSGIGNNMLAYDWTTSESDFGYPLEVSSSVYRVEDIFPFIASLQFENPNTLEAMMDNNNSFFQKEKPFLHCYEQSVTFCAPVNIVQSAWSNRASSKTEYSVDNLASLFDEGARIDVGAFNDFIPNACHQEVELKFTGPIKLSMPDSRPVVSVIIPCYNQAQYLPDAVESVINQTYQDWECIIVNDGSPDNTIEVAAELIKRNSSRNIILLEKNNGGISDARNFGISKAKGKFILPLDADDMIHSQMLQLTVDALERHPDIQIVYTDHIHFIDKTDRYQVVRVPAPHPGELLVHNCFAYCSLFRREVWETVGGYNNNMVNGYEDWDFWVGCIEKGFKIMGVHEPLFFYRIKESSRTTTAAKHDLELKSQIVLNHVNLFGQRQIAWAKGIQSGKPWALAIMTTEGFLPAEDLLSSNIPVDILANRETANDSLSKKISASFVKDKKETLNIVHDDFDFLTARGNTPLQLLESRDNGFSNIYKENLRPMDKCNFVICALFTANKPEFFKCADRLALSCEKYKLPYTIYIVPEIHKSLSPAGKDDPYFTRTNLIYYNLLRFPEKNILCLDADMFFMDYPHRIVEISDSGYDLAVYNWLNDEHNEAYIPVNRKIEAGNRHSDLYMFSHCIGFFSSEQLFCSGGGQFYRNSPEAKYLLELWQALIAAYPDFAEDQCLDFVYNNFILHKRDLKAFWLDKSYLRFPWWPHIKPVIIHPGLPSGGRSRQLTQIGNRQHFYAERCRPKNWNDLIFPRDCVVDTKEHVLFRIVNNQLVDPKPLQMEFYIYPEDLGVKENSQVEPQSSGLSATRPASTGNSLNRAKSLRVGRNDPCPCGSGKKYKKCCGIN